MAFLDIDLEKIVSDEGLEGVVLDDIGPAMHKKVSFDDKPMGMFHMVYVTKLPDGTKWLDFHSDKYAPSKEMMDFMVYCTDTYGLDNKDQGYPSQNDMSLLKNGKFGRYWEHIKILQIKRPENISLTISMRIIINNQDMSNFAKNLAKGFVRSAVNQVGRDGGRVVSNSIYNGKNYVPVSQVSPIKDQQQHNSMDETPGVNSIQFGQSVPENAIVVDKPFSTGKIIGLFLISFFFSVLGAIGVLIYGVSKYLDTSSKIQWYESIPQYAQDRRYKTGVRYLGMANVKRELRVPADPYTKTIHQKDGITAMLIGGTFILLWALLFIFT